MTPPKLLSAAELADFLQTIREQFNYSGASMHDVSIVAIKGHIAALEARVAEAAELLRSCEIGHSPGSDSMVSSMCPICEGWDERTWDRTKGEWHDVIHHASGCALAAWLKGAG